MIKKLLLIAGIFCCGLAHSQSTIDLLPTKQNGKWGYIDKAKNWVISPQYDYCLPFADRDFTWVKKGEQSLLINKNGATQNSLPFHSISDIFGDIIIYREQNQLGWYDKGNAAVVAAQYTNLQYLPTSNHFMTNDTQFYTVVDIRNQPVILRDSITHVRVDDFYFITSHKKTGVYTFEGERIIPEEYAHIQRHPDHFIAQDFKGIKHIYTSEGTLIYSGFFKEITPIYGPYFQCASEDKFYLLEASSGQLLDSTSGRYSTFSTGIIDIKNEKGRGLYNVNLKKRIIEPSFVNVFNQVGSSYIITYDGSTFGLIDSAGNAPNDKRYLTIGPYRSNVCIVREPGRYGLIGTRAQELLPANYSFLSVGDDGVIKGKRDSIFFLYEFDSQGRMIDSMQFNRTGTLTLRGRVSMSIVNGTSSNSSQISQYWFLDSDGKWGLRDPTGRIVVKPIYDEVQKLRNTNLVLGKVFASQSARLTRRMSILSSTTYGVVDERNFRPVVLSGIMYIDTSTLADDNVEVMRILMGGGFFSTINKRSGRILRYETKYISRFVNGHARIFMGTKLVLSTSSKITSISDITTYLNEFSFTSRGAPLNTQALNLAGFGYWAYLGPDGKYIDSPKTFEKREITAASDFKNGRAIVVDKNGYYGMINTTGDYVLLPTYKEISFLPNTNDSLLKTVSAMQRYGYVAEDGRVIAPVQYTKALPFESDATWAFTDRSTSLVRSDGTQDTFHGKLNVSPFYNGYGGIAEERKLAIITADGEVTSSYIYSRLGKYAEDLQPAKKRRVFGYLDENGEWAIEPQFYSAGPFVNGVAAVQYKPMYSTQKFYGYIDKNGDFLQKGKLTRAEDINSNGYALVKKGNLKGVVNHEGKLIIKPKYTKVYYGEGFFTTYHNSTITLYSGEGEKIKRIRGSIVNSGVSDGKQVVKRLRRVGAIDTTGKKVVDYKYFNLAPFEDGISINQKRRTVYILHQSGDTIAQTVGRAKGGFHSKYALIRNGRNMFFINHSGKNAFNLIFEDAEPFENRLARVKLNGKWGMIDAQGFYRIQPQYDFVRPPTRGVSIVGLNETAGICDLNANYIVAPRCNAVTYLLNEGVYQYTLKNEFGYMDTSGQLIWEVR